MYEGTPVHLLILPGGLFVGSEGIGLHPFAASDPYYQSERH
jgi:hypothetical protein